MLGNFTVYQELDPLSIGFVAVRTYDVKHKAVTVTHARVTLHFIEPDLTVQAYYLYQTHNITLLNCLPVHMYQSYNDCVHMYNRLCMLQGLHL